MPEPEPFSDGSPEVMTPEQAAAYLQINRETLYRYIRGGRIAASKIGRSWRLRKADLDRFLEENRYRGP